MKPININSLVQRYGPGYVAKTKRTGRVVAHAKRLDILFQKVKKREDVVISWIPKHGARYVFRISHALPLLLGRNIFKYHNRTAP